jgi:hypothetical protein
MDPFEIAIDLVFVKISWILAIVAILLFAFIGWARVPMWLTTAFAFLCTFFYVVSLTRHLEFPTADVWIARAVTTTVLALLLVIVYWVARTKLRSTGIPRRR